MSNSTTQTATPTQTSLALHNSSQPSYSFSKALRTSRPSNSNRSQPTSRSVSPAKPNTTSTRSSKASGVIPPATSSTTPATKPLSPLTAFHFTAQTSRPATSNITVSTAGVVAAPNSPSSTTSTSKKASVDDSAQRPVTITSTSPAINFVGFDTIIEGEEMETPVITRGSSTSYADSPMAKLMEQYSGEEDGADLSTESWVTLLVTKDDLELELIKKVENLNKGI